MVSKREFTPEEAAQVGGQLGADWTKVDAEQFRIGLGLELERAGVDPQAQVTSEEVVAAGRAVLARLAEYPEYYRHLEHLEEEAEEFWKDGRN